MEEKPDIIGYFWINFHHKAHLTLKDYGH